MKIVNYLLLLAALILFLFGLYTWLVAAHIDYAALYIALASTVYTVYLHSIKANKDHE